MTIVLPGMVAAQKQAWLALIEVGRKLPAGWCIVGGQMVHLFCWERGFTPTRPTVDGDAVLDVRGDGDILFKFTKILADNGFTPAGQSMEGHQHRWVRDEAKIDVLIPGHVGARAAKRHGVSGGTTVQTPGGQQALDRVERVEIEVSGTIGSVPRPNLVGALVIKAVIKAAAFGVTQDPLRRRHIPDFAILASMITRSDRVAAQLTRRDRQHLENMTGVMASSRAEWIGIQGAERGIDVLRNILTARRQADNLRCAQRPSLRAAVAPHESAITFVTVGELTQ